MGPLGGQIRLNLLLVSSVAVLFAGSCTSADSPTEDPPSTPSESLTPAEDLTYTTLPAELCVDLDRAELSGLTGDPGVLGSDEHRDLGTDFALVNQTSHCYFSYSDQESDISWSLGMKTQIAHFIDPDVNAWEETYEKDPYDIYSSNDENDDDSYIPAEELPLPLTRVVEAPGWDQAAVAEFIELDNRGTAWDPDGKAISFEYKLQYENMLVEFTFQLRGDGLSERPSIDPYVAMLTGLADQAKTISADASE